MTDRHTPPTPAPRDPATGQATGRPTPPALGAALAEFASTTEALIAIDFDGTLAPLVDEPLAARPLPGAVDRLVALSALPRTTVAIVSGRALATLRMLSGAPEPSLLLVGSHGVETSYADAGPADEQADETAQTGQATAATDETEQATAATEEAEQALFDALDSDLAAVLRDHPQARIERKPHSLVLHTRGLAAATEAAAVRDAEEVVARHPAVVVTPGKGVLEMATRHVGKGAAVRALAQRQHATATLYAGDDVTDEDAFAQLGEGDVTVKVGPEPTVAAHRLLDEHAVLTLLDDLLELRRAAYEEQG